MLEGPRAQAQARGARARDSSPPAPPTLTDSEDTPSPGAPADRQRRPLSGAPTPGELLAAPALPCKGKMPADPELAAPAVASSGAPELTGSALSTPGQRSARGDPAGSGPARRLIIPEGPAEAAGSGGPGCASRGEGSVELGTGERAGGVGNQYLQGRERALGEAVGEATRSAAALDHIMARKLSARKRARLDEAAGGAGCSGSRVQAGTSMAEEDGGMQGAVRVDELLEMIAQAGDQRLLQEARERASAGAAAAATAGDAGAAVELAGLESNGVAGAHVLPAEAADTGAPVLQIRGWRRSLVRALSPQARASGVAAASRDREPRAAANDDGRTDTDQADGGLALRASGGNGDSHTDASTAGSPSTPDGRGRSTNINASASRLAWRVDVSAECSGLGFGLAFLVSQDSEVMDLLSLDLPPAAQLALAPVLRGGADARGGLDVQEVLRTVAVYGAVAARRRDILQEAAGRHARNASMSHTRAPLDYARVRFRGDGPRGSGAAVDVEWDVVVGTDGVVTDDVNIQVWAPEGLSQVEATALVDKMKRLWEAVCVLKGPASALSVLVALL